MRWALFALRNTTGRSSLSNSAQACVSPSTEEWQGGDFNFLHHCFPPISPSHWGWFWKSDSWGSWKQILWRKKIISSIFHFMPLQITSTPGLQSSAQTKPAYLSFSMHWSLPQSLLGLRCWGTCGITYKWEGSNAKCLKCRLLTHILKCWSWPWESGLKGKASLV